MRVICRQAKRLRERERERVRKRERERVSVRKRERVRARIMSRFGIPGEKFADMIIERENVCVRERKIGCFI